MIESINLSFTIGGILLIVNAGVLAWILIETKREREEEPNRNTGLIIATNIVNLAWVVSHKRADAEETFNRVYSRALSCHAAFTKRLGGDICVQMFFAELVRELAFAAATKDPADRELYINQGLEFLANDIEAECNHEL